jgi:hypothetical protein
MIKQFKRVLTIDPGWTSGWAYFQGDLNPIYGDFKVDPTIDSKELRLGYMIHRFAELLDKMNPKLVYIEETDFRPGCLKSDVSHRMGHIHTLSNLIGCYFTICIKYKGIECRLLPVVSWKGNMDDAAVRSRVYSVAGRYYPNPHITDAVGMGFSRMGVFNKKKRKTRHKHG